MCQEHRYSALHTGNLHESRTYLRPWTLVKICAEGHGGLVDFHVMDSFGVNWSPWNVVLFLRGQ